MIADWFGLVWLVVDCGFGLMWCNAYAQIILAKVATCRQYYAKILQAWAGATYNNCLPSVRVTPTC